jgi:hypothetical protein
MTISKKNEKIAATIAKAQAAGSTVRYTAPVCHEWIDHEYALVPIEQCKHKADHHEPRGPETSNAAYFGLQRNSAGAFEFKPEPKVSESGRKIPDRTAENIAACAAVGLSYWSEAPGPGSLWAVDEHQQAHQVQIDRKQGTVTAGLQTEHGYRTVTSSWVKPANTEEVFALLDIPAPAAAAA